MKKLLMTLMLGAAMSSFAAFQYALTPGPNWAWPDSPPYGAAYTLTIGEGSGSIYLTDRTTYASFTTSVNAAQPGNFGYINLDTGVWSTAPATAMTLEDGRTAYKLGDFSAGDNVGIWVNTVYGDVGGTTGTNTTMGYSDNFNYRHISSPSNLEGQLQFNGYDSIFFQVTGVEGSPSGRPLPGVLASLLLGGASLGAFRRFARGRRAAA